MAVFFLFGNGMFRIKILNFIPPFLFPPVGEKISSPHWGKVGKGVINIYISLDLFLITDSH
jgi:hypothetical protein